jgi:Mannosyl-glycoprotein endo-beta-N-acetylglucosaminidase
MRKSITTLFCFFTILTSYAKADNSIESYISKYRLITQLESHRSGIPASIILAQAILESGYGNSDLCLRSKNHFGIKWKNARDGNYVYSLDDDYDSDGKHIPSKFIQYENDIISFHHHTDFLMCRVNYNQLFNFTRSDFTNWAYGLKDCGYSTDKTYGTQLIQIIKRYELFNYDLPDILTVKKTHKSVEDTKLMMKIFTGKNLNWSILLNKQEDILKQGNIAFAQAPKIKQNISSDLATRHSSSSKASTDFNRLNDSAYLRSRFQLG